MPQVATLVSHVQRAIDLMNQGNLWIGIGKTSAWGDPDVPPVYDPANHPENNVWWSNASSITELIGMKKVDTVKLVTPDINGIIEIIDEDGNSNRYSEITPAAAFTAGAKYLYLSGTLDNLLPYDTFRQTGIFSNVIMNGGVPAGRSYLIPSEINSVGTLEIIQNHAPQPRSANSRQKVQCVYEL